MMRRLSVALLLLIAIALPMRLLGQTGCDDSPESPTLILALVGVGGIFLWRLRSARRR
jgi:XrtJ-associated TM-motif-TM protein